MATVSTVLEPTDAAARAVPRRLNIFLSERARQDLQYVASLRTTTLTEVVKLGLALVKIAVEETVLRGNKLVIADATGKIVKEVVLPG